MRNKIYICVVMFCLILIIFSFSGCSNKFEKEVPTEVAEVDFWDAFYICNDAEYIATRFFEEEKYSTLEQGDFTILVRGTAGEECDLSGEEFAGLSYTEDVELALQESEYDWILAKPSVKDRYVECEFYTVMLYSLDENGNYYFVDMENSDYKCTPRLPHQADYYEQTVQAYFKENGIIASNVCTPVEQAAYPDGSEKLIYDYIIERGNVRGVVHVSFEWNGEGQFVPIDYEYSEELKVQLPPKGALLKEECEEDDVYVLRDNYFYPLTSLEEVEIYDKSGNQEEKIGVCISEREYGLVTLIEKVVSLEPEDSLVVFSKDTAVDRYFYPVWIPEEITYINAENEVTTVTYDWFSYKETTPRTFIDKNYYDVTEISVNGNPISDWKDYIMLGHYISGNKGDEVIVGGYQGSYYAEKTFSLDTRILERTEINAEKLTDFTATKDGYYLFDKSALVGGLYYENSSGCLVDIK